jgi:S-formylglutathione hydrolase FrmB
MKITRMRVKPRGMIVQLHMEKLAANLLIFLFLITGTWVEAAAQSQVLDIVVHSPGLEHNLLGDSADQRVSVYLPAAYRSEPSRRFSTIYFLHGFADTPVDKVAIIFQGLMDKLIASHAVEPMIVVAPNGLNRYMGSFYTNSEVTGNWEDYVVRDVVNYVDGHYRTLSDPGSRGITGHSMGGYGSLMLAFKHPDVFGYVYGMSPCCEALTSDLGPANPLWSQLGSVKSADDLPEILKRDFLLVVFIAMDAAFAPDPQNRPLLGDPPFRTEAKQRVPDAAVLGKFQPNLLTTAVASLLPSIRKLKGIYFDYGAEDEFSHIPLGVQGLSAQLSTLGVPHVLEVYEGSHGNHAVDRAEIRMLPWFSQNLKH